MKNAKCRMQNVDAGLLIHPSFNIPDSAFKAPLCLSSYRAGFVNPYSSVRVRPGAPFKCRMQNVECRIELAGCTDSAIRTPNSAFKTGLWCNSSISAREADGPGANLGFLTNSI